MIKRAVFSLLLAASICFMLLPAFAQSDVSSPEPEATQSEASTTEPEVDLLEPAEDESQFDVELDGRKTWTIRYGFGHPLGLAAAGMSPGQLTLDQTLTVNVVGKALSILTIEVHYDDQLPETMQSMAIYLDTDHLDGVLGDFSFGGLSDFTTHSKSMTGLQMEYLFGDAVLTAVVSKTEGVSESIMFVGQTTHAQIEYSAWTPTRVNVPAHYRRHLDGLAAFPLEVLYTEEFSTIHFHFEPSPNLRTVFHLYEVGFLFDVLDEQLQLDMETRDYRILEADYQVLLLQRDPLFLVRERLRDLVDVYNEHFELAGEQAKRYPFSPGTEYELGFLSEVARFANIVVDEVVYPLEQAQRRRFYDLGHDNVRANSVLVEVSADGRRFDTVPSVRLPDFYVTIHEQAGILELDFPATFYTPASIIRVGFDHRVAEGAFMLGLSVIPGSERVTLNNEPLQRDIDYMIDYEVGMLFMLIDLTDTDVIQVDFERFAGGLFGVAADYASYFYGLTLDLPVSDRLTITGNLLQLADAPGSVVDPDGVRTMPNRHTVAGIRADINLGEFTADVLVGYNQDRFPFDNNARAHVKNQINAIASGDGFVLFGHHGGVTVNDGGNWQTYGPGAGLSSRIVQAIAFGDGIFYLGTNTGLTIVLLDGSSPFDRAGNWARYFVDDGLPDPSVTALLVHDDIVWIGTRAGLIAVPADDVDPFESVTQFQGDGFAELPPVTALAAAGDSLYIGTENGVYVHQIGGTQLVLMPGTAGDFVNDLSFADGTLYVASNRGLRGFRNDRGMDWLILGEVVHAVVHRNGTVYYGLDTGLVAVVENESATSLSSWKVTALGVAQDGVWIGVRASEIYQMNVWLLSETEQLFPESITGISGVDQHAFIDIPAAGHTTTGWIARAAFSHVTDDYTLRGVVESRPPSFRPVGSFRRADSTGWTLTGDIPLGRQGTLQVDHDYRMMDQHGLTPRDRMENNVSLNWSFGDGPQWSASVRQVETNETDAWGNESTHELATSFSVSESFFRDDLSLGLAWNHHTSETDRWNEHRQSEKLSLSFDWHFSPALSSSGSWSRPIRRAEEGISGSEHLNWNWDWAAELGFAGLDVEYGTNWTRTLFEETSSWSHNAEVRLDGDSFQAAGWDFAPDLKLEGDHQSATTDLEAEFTVRSQIEVLTLRTTLRAGLTELGRPVFNRNGELIINARYTGLKDLDARLTYTGNRGAAVKGDQIVASSSDSLTGRLVWMPEDGPRNEFSFSVRIRGIEPSQQVTASIDHGFTMDVSSFLAGQLERVIESYTDGYPIADIRVDSKAEYRSGGNDPTFSLQTTGRVHVAIAPRWSVSFASTYRVGHKTRIGLYHGFLFELTFAIDL